jgi:hypothetical protein
MKNNLILCFACLSLLVPAAGQISRSGNNSKTGFDYIEAFKDTLSAMADRSDEAFFILHCQSMIDVIESRTSLSSIDTGFIEDLYFAFNNTSDTCSMKDFNSYIKRRRSLVIAWTSPTDGTTSFSWLKLPKDWNPEIEYPLYIQLHGLWNVANNPIEYLSYPFSGNPSTTVSFEDGYLLSPWGRGNLWYQGISETDIWECMAALEEVANINPARKYLSGHSMGGYGAWHIALNSPNTWAALGVHAGALWYGTPNEVTAEAAETLKDLPTYFVCGTNDGLLSINQTAYGLLDDAGNENIEFVTFVGGHDYFEENVLNMYLWMREFLNEDWNGIDIEIQPTISNFSCAPNPFRSGTRILYTLKTADKIRLEIVDPNGRLLQLITDEYQSAGNYITSWSAEKMPAGIYFCRLRCNTFSKTLKMIVE